MAFSSNLTNLGQGKALFRAGAYHDQNLVKFNNMSHSRRDPRHTHTQLFDVKRQNCTPQGQL